MPFEVLKPVSKEDTDASSLASAKKENESALNIYGLKPLDLDDIRQFARHYSAPEIEPLIIEIQRANLMEMASRPFDLETLLSKWEADGQLGSRLESLQHMVDVRLDEIDPSRKQRQPLNKALARDGVRRLAAAVTLSGEAGVLVPDITHEKVGIDAEKVLADWHNPNDVRTLLERGIFNDILYGAVRFRHRDIRELLTAEWLYDLLQKGNSRRQIESLLFREQYGEKVVVPRLRPILSWLILFDESIRERALGLHPEIAVEGGDAACLPRPIRQGILNDIVNRIVADEDDRGARDNSAIARIAQNDLSDDTLRLIAEHRDNDDAIFFLGRLVWQGGMKNCIDSLISIATDPNRDIYPRIASVRAVATVGSQEQLKSLWVTISNQPDTIPRRLLVELLEETVIDGTTVELLLVSIEKLTPYERYEASELDQALHMFLDRFTALTAQERKPLLTKLCIAFNNFLDREPYHERLECRVSTGFTWLMGPANHVVEILVSDQAIACFDNAVTDILLKIPALREWAGDQLNEHKDELKALIPAWKEFNDVLFWRNIDEARTRLAKKDRRLTDSWEVQWMEHYWDFGSDSFYRVVEYIQTRELEDDKLVALSLAFRIYKQADNPTGWKTDLEQAVKGNEVLVHCLDQLLNPPVSEERERWEKKRLGRKRKREKERLEFERSRSLWVKSLRENPEIVRDPPDFLQGDWSNDQYHLFCELNGSDWRVLIKEFGEKVALAFRDAAIKYWRIFTPGLRSEGFDSLTSPYSLNFALAGLAFESSEVESFPSQLTEVELLHALRYVIYELNSSPNWLETVFEARPHLVLESILKELSWEFDNIQPSKPVNYILSDIACSAPWIHAELTSFIKKRISVTAQLGARVLSHCFKILEGGQVTPEWFAGIAQSKINEPLCIGELPIWYALWVDTDSEAGIAATKSWLESMEEQDATLAAEQFITQLLGGGQTRGVGTGFNSFKTGPFLKELYLMMHRYIRLGDDNNRGSGMYSPNIRDDAQDARNSLFSKLTEIPGKQTYIALQDLAKQHPSESHRPWMLKQARKRAEQDADLEPWTASQVYNFSSCLKRVPTSHRQLFDLGLLHLNDFKDWLERGNDSLYETYQRVKDETEMRKVVAHCINTHAEGLYTCAQENELANSQRPDIWLQHPHINSPVPIELKLLDKSWSGPDLCERLRNQLAGDYLREETAGCGIFLLILTGANTEKKNWRINGKLVDVAGLQLALVSYWTSISSQFPNVIDIDVVVVDLSMRSLKSNV